MIFYKNFLRTVTDRFWRKKDVCKINSSRNVLICQNVILWTFSGQNILSSYFVFSKYVRGGGFALLNWFHWMSVIYDLDISIWYGPSVADTTSTSPDWGNPVWFGFIRLMWVTKFLSSTWVGRTNRFRLDHTILFLWLKQFSIGSLLISSRPWPPCPSKHW